MSREAYKIIAAALVRGFLWFWLPLLVPRLVGASPDDRAGHLGFTYILLRFYYPVLFVGEVLYWWWFRRKCAWCGRTIYFGDNRFCSDKCIYDHGKAQKEAA